MGKLTQKRIIMKSPNCYFVLIILYFTVYCGCSEKNTDDLTPFITITGKVVDKETGKAIAGCEVQLDSEQFVRTGEDGLFSIMTTQRESYTLIFTAKDYSTKSIIKTVIDQSIIDFGTIQLEMSTVTLKGKVTDKISNSPVVGCRVEYEKEKFAFTNSNGDFVLEKIDINPEGYSLMFIKENYSVLQETRQASQLIEIDFGAVTITPEITLSGIVLDKSTNTPIENCTVNVQEKMVTTAIDGRFTIQNLQPQTAYLLKFTSAGYLSKELVKSVTITNNTCDVGNIILEKENQAITSLNDLSKFEKWTVVGGKFRSEALPANASGNIVFTSLINGSLSLEYKLHDKGRGYFQCGILRCVGCDMLHVYINDIPVLEVGCKVGESGTYNT